ncbi:MAG: phage major tail protein, TP901-1 family [Hyphomicrobiaceae bacterium]|nr:phage major tail protein, TP901-1 family [Hyphomicrobiaceae bacterium]
MAIQKGKDLLIKVDETGTGAFVTIAGLRTRRLSFNAETVDVTHTESAGRWRELLAGAGVRRAHVSGAGVFRDDASDAAMRALFFSGDIRPWRIVIPDFGTVEGPFQIVALEYTGEHASELTFDAALESAGALAFTAL